jgi:hypothetical protein
MDDDSDRASARRWHMPRWGALTLVALVMAAAVGVLAEEVRKPGVYWSDVRVRFVAPTTLTKQNSLQVTEQSLIMMAGAVGQMVDDTNGPRPASPDATLVGLGVRSGWWVVLPNTGGQYQNSYSDPYLDVQVVAPTAAQVAQTLQRLVQRIHDGLATLQNDAHVAPQDRISSRVLPLSVAPIYYAHGSHSRAVIASLVILIGLASVGFVVASRLPRRLSRQRDAARPPVSVAT